MKALTQREREIAALVAAGLDNKAIAGQLWISGKTLEAHLARIGEKVGHVRGSGYTARILIARWSWEHQRREAPDHNT